MYDLKFLHNFLNFFLKVPFFKVFVLLLSKKTTIHGIIFTHFFVVVEKSCFFALSYCCKGEILVKNRTNTPKSMMAVTLRQLARRHQSLFGGAFGDSPL
jgi:hypothetical protein